MTPPKKHWTAADMPRQDGRTFVVTGANSGLGFQTALELARHGATVVLAVRDENKGRAARDRIRAAVPGAALEVRHLDLADLDSVRAFAETLLAERPGLDVLINNAGIMLAPHALSKQGFESQFAGNHLGHFALTGRLLPALRASDDARVVTVSSTLHKRGSIHFDDLDGRRNYNSAAFYSQSKFANVLFGLELDRRLRAHDVPIRSVLAHPGYSATNLQLRDTTGVMNALMRIGNAVMAQPAAIGALNQLYAATDPHAESGAFYGPGLFGEWRGYPALVQPVRAATDPALARRFWDLSEELTGVRFSAPLAGI
jgi:NAD(P)-dependent dehydrogenase (short-subunit alcohol dehydrogenase family)